ncbi:NAD-dependent epimerase/dehydratase family protein [Paracoccus sp. TK19116]|uniref:GDP-L-fucose synthase n=1 Tax=Paracoccus albicereus TaxID=2922394 RepID=A0ABT1MR96_9RHOB|nr:NAD-dependent epimerase/dehydratase family protein [Paracoccus albicereus]MCQ0970823.1 NAD-dependent epimerase/dehydratase family protein [Paracoccus albicereus]
MRVLLTGGTGLLGRAIIRQAAREAPGVELLAPPRADLDLLDRAALRAWFNANRVDAVIHSAARVGGIQANLDDPEGFLIDNLRLDDALMSAADAAGVGRLIYIGSSCMYPRDHRQPLVEEDLLAGPLEPSNEGYALAKIVGAKRCAAISAAKGRAWRTIIPCNLFGVDDHFGSHGAHLVAAAIAKIVEARDNGAGSVTIWGDGHARREFLEADHLARFLLRILPDLSTLPDCLNVGAGRDHAVNDYYRMIADVAGYDGAFTHDLSRPAGMSAKLISSDRAAMFGYRPPEDLTAALSRAVAACERGRVN